MYSDILPLRAVLFQFIFLLIAISLETLVLYRNLELDYKSSVQYATTINLFSTVIGWIIFFIAQPFLPQGLKAQLISFIFFERFFSNSWFATVSPLLIMLSLGVFLGTFLVKWQGLKLLEFLLEKKRDRQVQPVAKTPRFRARSNLVSGLRSNSEAYAVFVGNAFSFSAILFLLFVRLIEQTYGTSA